ncbi:unnamed protein product, partial [Pylaiella littoralis]
ENHPFRQVLLPFSVGRARTVRCSAQHARCYFSSRIQGVTFGLCSVSFDERTSSVLICFALRLILEILLAHCNESTQGWFLRGKVVCCANDVFMEYILKIVAKKDLRTGDLAE